MKLQNEEVLLKNTYKTLINELNKTWQCMIGKLLRKKLFVIPT